MDSACFGVRAGAALVAAAFSGAVAGATATAGHTADGVGAPDGAALTQEMARGCWVRFYNDSHYEGQQFTIIGPKRIPDMRTWDTGIDSAIVGPNARVHAYSDENYLVPTLTLEPGQKVANLHTELGFWKDVESLKVVC